MDLKTLRTDMTLSQQALAERLGVGKSYICMIEKGQEAGRPVRVSMRLAFKIEQLSKGAIPATTLNPDIAMVEAALEAPAQDAA